MTMPHLMNCEHSADGWCLECIKELYDKAERHRAYYFHVAIWLAEHVSHPVPSWCFLHWPISDEIIDELIQEYETQTGKSILDTPYVTEEEGPDAMIFLEGSERSFRCECRCNVFRTIGNLEYRCNACGAIYHGDMPTFSPK